MVFVFDDFELNVEHLELRRSGRLLSADALVLRLLAYLVQTAGRLVSKEELVDKVWNGRAVADNAVTVSMARLRKLLGQGRRTPEYVTTTYGRGYRFVREVIVRHDTHPSPASSGAHDDGPPFVGRERVLAQLRRAFAEVRAGRGRGCLLIGEPGIGKTRAVETFLREVGAPEARVAWGFCREAGDTPPLSPWVRLLSDVLLAGDDPSATSVEALPNDLRAFLGLGPDGGRNSPEPPTHALEALGNPTRHRHFDSILRRFVGAAERTPWVLVIDDLHRADAASLELLLQLLDEIAHARILLVATLRHAPDWKSRCGTYLPNVLGHRNCERITLERLEKADVLGYVAALLDDPDAELGRAVYQKSEGNPFFMAELARALVDSRQADPRTLAVPAVALELVRQRVSRFDGEAREVLSAAAVVGRSFELPMLAAITERDPSQLMVALDQAIEAEVVVAAPGSMTAFAFGHALLREVLYDALPATEQRAWHLRIVRALEQRVASGDSIPASELAYHAHAALPEGDIRQTIQHCRAAAAAAAAVFAGPDVVRYARHALEALDLMERPSIRLRMALYYLIAMFARGFAPDECARAIREVARLADETRDPVMLLRAAVMYNAQPGFEPIPGYGALLERVLELFRPDQKGFLSVTLASLALAHPNSYSAARSGELLDRALPLCRESGSPLALYAVLVCKLYRFGGPAHVAEAAEVAGELERQVVQNPGQTPALPVALGYHRAVTAFQSGDLAAVTAANERASLRAHSIRSAHSSWHAERMMALTRIQQGITSRGSAELASLHERAEHGTIWGAELFCAFDKAVTLTELGGKTKPLDATLHAALQFRPSDPPGIWATKLRALAGSGKLDEARAALHAVPARSLSELPCDRDYLGTLGHLTRAVLLLHERDYAEALYALLEPYPDWFAVGTALYCEGSVAQLLGMLSLATGRPSRAIAHFETSLRNCERAGLALRALETRLQLAHCLSQAESGSATRRAHGLALEAQTSATRLGHAAFLTEAVALLSRNPTQTEESLPNPDMNVTDPTRRRCSQH